MAEQKERETFEGYVILELMGHRRLGGYLREATIGGGAFLRIDVPGKTDGEVVATQYYSPSAVYCITPTTEMMARAAARQNEPALVSEWDLKQAGLLKAPAETVQKTAWEDRSFGSYYAGCSDDGEED